MSALALARMDASACPMPLGAAVDPDELVDPGHVGGVMVALWRPPRGLALREGERVRGGDGRKVAAPGPPEGKKRDYQLCLLSFYRL